MGFVMRCGKFDVWVYWAKDLNERMHVHVYLGGKSGKVWLEPAVEYKSGRGYTRREIPQIEAAIRNCYESLAAEWRRKRESAGAG